MDKDLKKENSKFKFGDLIENGYASERNPIRLSIFIGYGFKSGRINSGKYLKLISEKDHHYWESGIDNDKLKKVGDIFTRERQRTLEEVWDKYVERCDRCNGEGWWSYEEDGELLSHDCERCNQKGFFFNAWKYDEDIKKLSKLQVSNKE